MKTETSYEIERLFYRYAYGIDAGDFDGVSQILKKATLLNAHGETIAKGAAQIRQFYQTIIKIYPDTGTPKTQHVISNILIENETTFSLSATANYSVFQKLNNNKIEAIICGQYHSLFRLAVDGWEFHQHQTTPLMIGDMSQHLKINIRDIADKTINQSE